MLLTLALTLALGAPRTSVDSVTLRAREAKARGDAALDAGQAAEALKNYEESWALKQDPALLYNQARAHQAMGQYPRALELLEQFIRDAPTELKARVPQLTPLLDDLRDRTCMIGVHVSEDGAEVRLKDRILGTTPLQKLVVNSGKTQLEVRKEGFTPYVVELELPPNGWLEHDVKLTPLSAALGTLEVKTTPPSAEVRIDSKIVGSSPLDAPLPPGTHELSLFAPDFQKITTTVTIRAGENTLFSVSLVGSSTSPAWYQRWYVWAGVAVLVAGGVVGSVYAATTERAPTPGSLGFATAGFSFPTH